LEIILLTIHGQKPLIGKLFISNFFSIGKKKKPNDVISQMKNMRKKNNLSIGIYRRNNSVGDWQ
jgi:hypothetical protein